MRYILILAIITLCSCHNNKKNTDKLAVDFALTKTYMDVTHLKSQQFIDALAESFTNRQADTTLLLALLDSSRQEIDSRLNFLAKIEGTTEMQAYKKSCVALSQHLAKLNTKVYPDIIRSLQNGNEDSFREAGNRLKPYLLKMQDLQAEMVEAEKRLQEATGVTGDIEDIEPGTYKY